MCPTCPAASPLRATVAEVEQEIRAAIRFHIDGLEEDGLPVPEPQSVVECVEA
jgi:predicted RNase H-like HicB family nuclease